MSCSHRVTRKGAPPGYRYVCTICKTPLKVLSGVLIDKEEPEKPEELEAIKLQLKFASSRQAQQFQQAWTYLCQKIGLREASKLVADELLKAASSAEGQSQKFH